MSIDRFANPALVVVDMQNDFVRVGAPLEVPEARVWGDRAWAESAAGRGHAMRWRQHPTRPLSRQAGSSR
jgi:nicotinamidase-related amidase